MKVVDIIKNARACCARMPVRVVSEPTLRSYKRVFARMWKEPVLDPLKPGIAVDTYYGRRAALHTVGRLYLEGLVGKCIAADEKGDVTAAREWAAAVQYALERIEEALSREPPMPPGSLPWHRPPSRWHQSDVPHPKRGANSKRHVLGDLPNDWDARLWDATPTDWRHRDALAVHLTIPVRGEELVPGHRPQGWSPGVRLELSSENRLALTFLPVKSHHGLFGTGLTTVTVDPFQVGGPAAYLAERCASSGGWLVVSTRSKNAVRKALEDLGKLALPETDVTITPYVIRHQLLADLKATFGGGVEVAAAAGQCTDRTQAKYGSVHNGRKRKGYLSVTSRRKPRAGNVARGRQLGQARHYGARREMPSA